MHKLLKKEEGMSLKVCVNIKIYVRSCKHLFKCLLFMEERKRGMSSAPHCNEKICCYGLIAERR